MSQAFLNYYRCPESFADFTLPGELSEDSGFFRFGEDAVCYGPTSSGFRAPQVRPDLYDALASVGLNGASPQLPFDPTEVIENLRRERYLRNSHGGERKTRLERAVRNTYYLLRPGLPVSLRKHLQRAYLRGWKKLPFPSWPVDRTVENIVEKLLALSLKAHSVKRVPFIWFWPEGVLSATILTHDVEALPGRNFCSRLMDLDDSAGVKSSFQIVPEERYPVPASFLDSIRKRGFEINVHDTNHDGFLFSNRERFLRRAERINRYGKQFAALGFRSGVLYRNADWVDALDFSYDLSIPNVAHLEPQRGGCCTVMPFFIGKILELPLTTAQDYSLFHILQDYSINLWKRQITLITEKHGVISLLIHPDYVIEKRAQDTYRALLNYLTQLRADRKTWIALPREVNQWWRERSQMKLIRQGQTWQIEGPGKERARIAYASLDRDRVVYNIEQEPQRS